MSSSMNQDDADDDMMNSDHYATDDNEGEGEASIGSESTIGSTDGSSPDDESEDEDEDEYTDDGVVEYTDGTIVHVNASEESKNECIVYAILLQRT